MTLLEVRRAFEQIGLHKSTALRFSYAWLLADDETKKVVEDELQKDMRAALSQEETQK
jgi:hypothetical protein